MSAEIYLITGGRKSGKSRYALQLADELIGKSPPLSDASDRLEKKTPNRLFVATCPSNLDSEMQVKIKAHQKEREILGGWTTLEETLFLENALQTNKSSYSLFLIDCLGLWVNNFLYQKSANSKNLHSHRLEKELLERIHQIIDICKSCCLPVIFVSTETGLGIIPENKMARLFSDLLGICSQVFASHSKRVYWVSSGIPVLLKG